MKFKAVLVVTLLFIAKIYGQNRVPYLVDTIYGYSDYNGELIIPAKYDKASLFYQNGYAIVDSSQYRSVIDINGVSLLTTFSPNTRGWFTKLVMKRPSNGKIYYIFGNGSYNNLVDEKFNRLLSLPDSNDIFSWHQMTGLVKVGKGVINKDFAFYNLEGKRITKWFENNILAISVGGEKFIKEKKLKDKYFRLYNFEGVLVSDKKYSEFKVIEYDTSEALMLADVTSFELRNNKGELLLPPVPNDIIYDEVKFKNTIDIGYTTKQIFEIMKRRNIGSCYHDDLNDKFVFITNSNKKSPRQIFVNGKKSLTGNQIFRKYVDCRGAIIFKEGERMGCINLLDDTLINLEKQKLVYYNGSNTIVVIKDRFYYLYNLDENKIEERKYNRISLYELESTDNSKVALHIYNGFALTNFKYQSIKKISGKNKFLCKLESNYELIDSTGSLIAEFEYNYIRQLKKGDFFLIKKNGLFGICDLNGKEIVPPEYKKCLKLDGKPPFLLEDVNGIVLLANSQGKIYNSDIPVTVSNIKKYRDGTYSIDTGKNKRFYSSHGVYLFDLNGFSYDLPKWKRGLLINASEYPYFYYCDWRSGIEFKRKE
ncbi:hypothetical protein CEQ90_19825 [Lewinellaceae bacterium SD302]|nr:hypothetical protein CEQ90_19825 [Lewinellaceae bacterium SD302]